MLQRNLSARGLIHLDSQVLWDFSMCGMSISYSTLMRPRKILFPCLAPLKGSWEASGNEETTCPTEVLRQRKTELVYSIISEMKF